MVTYRSAAEITGGSVAAQTSSEAKLARRAAQERSAKGASAFWAAPADRRSPTTSVPREDACVGQGQQRSGPRRPGRHPRAGVYADMLCGPTDAVRAARSLPRTADVTMTEREDRQAGFSTNWGAPASLRFQRGHVASRVVAGTSKPVIGSRVRVVRRPRRAGRGRRRRSRSVAPDLEIVHLRASLTLRLGELPLAQTSSFPGSAMARALIGQPLGWPTAAGESLVLNRRRRRGRPPGVRAREQRADPQLRAREWDLFDIPADAARQRGVTVMRR
jgi:hypothetical protein